LRKRKNQKLDRWELFNEISKLVKEGGKSVREACMILGKKYGKNWQAIERRYYRARNSLNLGLPK